MGRKEILTVTASFRKKEDVNEVEGLEEIRKAENYTQAEVYLLGLRTMANAPKVSKKLIKKVKDLVKAKKIMGVR